MEWSSRKVARGTQNVERKPRATWAAVVLAVCSLFVQVTNFVRTDLKPLLEAARQSRVELNEVREIVDRVDKQFDVRAELIIDHEERLGTLEQRRDAKVRAQQLVQRLEYQANRKK